jgi:hypothetical protein
MCLEAITCHNSIDSYKVNRELEIQLKPNYILEGIKYYTKNTLDVLTRENNNTKYSTADIKISTFKLKDSFTFERKHLYDSVSNKLVIKILENL